MRTRRAGTIGEWGARRGGFTLIELLVVVAIIVLLLAILMPSLSSARESAKTVKCLSNLKQIGVAMQSYFLDHDDWFPFSKRADMPYPLLHSFHHGGHPGRQLTDDPEEEQWWGYVEEEFRDTPAGRPLNPYIYPNLPDWHVEPDDPLYEVVRDMPVFECPSDVGGFWHTYDGLESITDSLYWFSGSSYTMNYHFARFWAYDKWGDEPLVSIRWLHRANAYLHRQFQRNSSTFVILFEDPFDSAQWHRIPRRGWHKQWMKHTLLFLDGHAANMLADTTQGSRGLGWKTGSGSSADDPLAWWNDPDDPDYRYRDLTPLPGR